MSDLLTRLKAATAEQQHELILQALWHAREREWITEERYYQAVSWCDDGAFESAALTLVPEGMMWLLCSDGTADIGREPASGTMLVGEFEGEAATPALAFVIAALRARDV